MRGEFQTESGEIPNGFWRNPERDSGIHSFLIVFAQQVHRMIALDRLEASSPSLVHGMDIDAR